MLICARQLVLVVGSVIASSRAKFNLVNYEFPGAHFMPVYKQAQEENRVMMEDKRLSFLELHNFISSKV